MKVVSLGLVWLDNFFFMANQKFNKFRSVIGLAAVTVFAVAGFLLWSNNQAAAQPTTESDAIGIRIIPNPNHYSVYRWYQSQGFSGAPQALTVDGYEALRDGRTVYINAAHVDPAKKVIYTNIYLISYNQDSSSKTTDILGQIISHWKFNDNLSSQVATCSVSAVKCAQDSDCPSNQACSLSNGTCLLKEAKNCVVDSDCPAGLFCGSLKAMIIRDLKRIGKTEEIREALSKYKEANGTYPLLAAGTYLPGKTTSLWPSWSEVFLPTIGIKTPIVDPVNRFGSCPGYDSKTCWNPTSKQFVTGSGPALALPANSYALAYTSNQAGSSYNLCAVMESRDTSNPALGYRLEPGVNDDNCVTATGVMATGSLTNKAPQIVDLALKGVSGKEFNGFARAVDSEGDPITWTISTGGTWSGWSAAPIIKGVSDVNQKKIYAVRAGNAGNYPITLTVTDSKGLSSATTSNIEIASSSAFGQADEYTYRLDPTVPFSFSFYVSGETSVPSYVLDLVSGIDILRFPGIVRSVASDGVNRHKITYQGIIATSSTGVFNEDKESVYSLRVNGATSNFIIRVKIDPPTLEFNCETQSRLDSHYKCRLGTNKQGVHTISYSSDGPLPAGLNITEDPIAEPGVFYLSGKTFTLHTGQEVRIKAVNEYGNPNIKSFVLRVNNYCGDGIAQDPNTEGRGGIFNNGYEACDGMSNVALSAAGSSYKRQYACNTAVNETTPYPINSNNYCVFKSPLEGGGYCGDLYCQTNYEDNTTGSTKFCPYDCDPNYFGEPPSLPDPDTGGVTDTACSGTNPCPTGYDCVNSLCQIKCWDRTETTTAVEVKSGDVSKPGNYAFWQSDGNALTNDYEARTFSSVHVAGCGDTQSSVKVCTNNGLSFQDPDDALTKCRSVSVIRMDNPMCSSLSIANCPTGCNSRIGQITTISGGEDCKKSNSNLAGWDDRSRVTCYGDRTVKRCVADKCRTTLGSTVEDGYMSLTGQCLKPASCSATTPCAEGSTCQGESGYCAKEGSGGVDVDCEQEPSKEDCEYMDGCRWVGVNGVCVPTPLKSGIIPGATSCPAGKYLSAGACLTCAAGTYKSGTNTATSCTMCPVNSYCPAGAAAPTACPNTYTAPLGSDSSSDCKAPSSGGSVGGTCIPQCPTTTGYCGSDGCGGTCACQTGLTCKSASEPICVCNSECAYSPETSDATHHYNCAQINSYCSPYGGWCNDGTRQPNIYNQSGYAVPGEECDNGTSNITVGVEPTFNGQKYYGSRTYCNKNCDSVTYNHYCGDGICDKGLIGTQEFCGQLCTSGGKTYNDCPCSASCPCPTGKTCSNGLCVTPTPPPPAGS